MWCAIPTAQRKSGLAKSLGDRTVEKIPHIKELRPHHPAWQLQAKGKGEMEMYFVERNTA